MTYEAAMHAATAPLEHDPLTAEFDPAFGDGDMLAEALAWEAAEYADDALGASFDNRYL